VDQSHKDWSLKLDDALWAYRTACKTPLGTTLYLLVFGNSCHLPIEMEYKVYWATKTLNFDLKEARERRFLQFNQLDELRLEAYESSRIYKERTRKWHDKHIMKKRFEKADIILLFHSRLRLFPG